MSRATASVAGTAVSPAAGPLRRTALRSELHEVLPAALQRPPAPLLSPCPHQPAAFRSFYAQMRVRVAFRSVCVSLMNNVGHIFLYLLSIPVSSLDKCLFRSWCVCVHNAKLFTRRPWPSALSSDSEAVRTGFFRDLQTALLFSTSSRLGLLLYK